MDMKIKPTSVLGKWSVWLNALFVLAIVISLILVKVLGILSFDNHWWDVTVAVIFPASLLGLVTGIIAVTKKKEGASSVYLSILTGTCMILFLVFHSLFISD